MTDPGRLNRRLALEAPAETPDGAGGVIRVYETVATLWAEVTPLSARADVAEAHRGAAVTYRIVIRAGREITTRHRLRDDGRVFRILSVRESDASRRFLDIRAEQQTD